MAGELGELGALRRRTSQAIEGDACTDFFALDYKHFELRQACHCTRACEFAREHSHDIDDGQTQTGHSPSARLRAQIELCTLQCFQSLLIDVFEVLVMAHQTCD